MVRISNARMSGTALGTIVPHIAPESTIEGPLSLVEDGDLIELDVNNQKIHLYILATTKVNLCWPSFPVRVR